MKRFWFKFYGQEYLGDPKMSLMGPIERSIWLTLLCLASATNNGIIKNVSLNRLKVMSGMMPGDECWDKIENILDIFKVLEMISYKQEETGMFTVTVTNFIKRQGNLDAEDPDEVLKRVRKFRSSSERKNPVTVTIEKKRKEKNIYNNIYIKKLSNNENEIKEFMDKFSVSRKFVLDRADDVIDYCEAKGKTYSNYKAALRNFIKSHLAKHPECIIEKKELPKIEEDTRTPEEKARDKERRDKILLEARQKIIKQMQ